MKNKFVLAKMVMLALVAMLVIAPAANADLLSGYLTTDPSDANYGILATDGWAGTTNGFKIAWDVEKNAAGTLWEYTYTITGAATTLSKDLSHLILQVSDTATIDNFFNFSPGIASGDPRTYSPSDSGKSNPGLPADIYGFKFDATGSSATIYFESVKGPTQGSFYAKDGDVTGKDKIHVYAYNTGLNPLYESTWVDGMPFPNMFITRPDSSLDIPLPPSAWLLGSGLIGLAGLGWRRRKS
jgi:hypothetical protein